jgi:phage anti-repressor protein
MTKLYTLINNTTLHKVSGYWKERLPTIFEVEEIANQLNWNVNSDFIVAHSNVDKFKLIYNTKKWLDINVAEMLFLEENKDDSDDSDDSDEEESENEGDPLSEFKQFVI